MAFAGTLFTDIAVNDKMFTAANVFHILLTGLFHMFICLFASWMYMMIPIACELKSLKKIPSFLLLVILYLWQLDIQRGCWGIMGNS